MFNYIQSPFTSFYFKEIFEIFSENSRKFPKLNFLQIDTSIDCEYLSEQEKKFYSNFDPKRKI